MLSVIKLSRSIIISRKGIQVKFFTVDQNVDIRLKSFHTEIEVSTSCRFQDNAVQNQQFSFYFGVAFLSVL